ncbi:hypothetical protein HDU76_003972 [Blyttiomyces sp. JEL0837]|nr:hypothetical protein HDU76_003972 [Blyttiomyces sp. JEL0837]
MQERNDESSTTRKLGFYELYASAAVAGPAAASGAGGTSSDQPIVMDTGAADSDTDSSYSSSASNSGSSSDSESIVSKHQHGLPRADIDQDEFDPETMLYMASDATYSRKTYSMMGIGRKGSHHATNTPLSLRDRNEPVKERNLVRRVKGWYSPVYDYKTPGLSEKQRKIPRYCGGKLKRWQFILLHVFLAGTLLMFIMAPIFYFIIIPKIIQDTINKTSTTSFTLNQLSINRFENTTVGFDLNAQIPPPTIFPIKANLGALTLHVYDDSNNQLLLDAEIPGLSFTLNELIVFNISTAIQFKDSNVHALASLVDLFSTKGLTEDKVFMARANVKIGIWGITFYSALPIYKAINSPNVKADLLSVYSAFRQYASVGQDQMNNLIEAKYNQSDLITIIDPSLFPLIALRSMDIEMTDDGMEFKIGSEFQNPSKATIDGLESIEVGLELEGVNIARVELQNYSLKSSLQRMNLTVGVKFDTSNPGLVAGAISNAVDKVLVRGDLNLSLAMVGPISLKQVGVIQTFTDALAVKLPAQELLTSLKVDQAKTLISGSGLSNLLSNSSFSVDVTSQFLNLVIDLGLSRILALPPTIAFPYNITMGLYGFGQKTLQIDVNGLTVNTDESRIGVSTGVTVTPVNTMKAADALAGVFNPVLAAVPKDSSIDVKDVGISDKVKSYKWVQSLFGANNPNAATINFGIPGSLVNVPSIIDMFTANETALPFNIKSLHLDQLPTEPGFSAKGSLGIALPGALPKLSVAIGYFSTLVQVEDSALATANLPSGLTILPESNTPKLTTTSQINLDASLVMAPTNASLTKSLQNLVDAALGTSSIDSSFGITNILFGTSASSPFITFSKIRAQVGAAQLQPLLSRAVTNFQDSVLVPGIVKLTSASLNVESSTKVSSHVEATVKNPTAIDATLPAGLSLEARLDNLPLATASIGPLSIGSGTGFMALDLGLALSNGANGVSGKVNSLFNAILGGSTSDFGKGPAISVAGIVIQGPNGNSQAKIDQLAGVNIKLPVGTLNKINPFADGSGKMNVNGVVDASQILPSSDVLGKFNVTVGEIDFSVVSKSQLAVGGAFGYINPLALTASLPYFSANLGIAKSSNAVSLAASNLVLGKGQGTLSPSAEVTFGSDASIPQALASAVSDVVNTRKLSNTPISVSTIRFGTSASDISNLLSEINLDVSKYVKDIDIGSTINSIISTALPFKLPATLTDLENFTNTAAAGGLITLATKPGKTLQAGANLQLNLPFAVKADVGYLGVGVAVGGSDLTNLLLPKGLSASSVGKMVGLNLDAGLQFVDDAKGQDVVAALVKSFFDGKSFGTTLNIRNLVLGTASGDRMTVLSAIDLALKLDDLLKLTGPTDVASLLSTFNTTLAGQVAISTKPSNRLGVAATVDLKFPIGIKADLGFLGAQTNLDSNPLANLVLPSGISIAPDSKGVTGLNINTDLIMTDNDATQTSVAAIVNRLINGQKLAASVSVAQLAIGSSSSDTITAFSKVSLPLDLDSALQIVLGVSGPIVNVNDILKNLNPTIGATDIKTKPQATLGVSTSVQFSLALPLNVSLQVGYLAAQGGISGATLAAFALPGFALNRDGGRKSMAIATDLAFIDNDAARTNVATLVNNYISGSKIAGTLDVSKVKVGASATDLLTVLSKVNAGLDLDLVATSLLNRTGPVDLGKIAGDFVSNSLKSSSNTFKLQKAALNAQAGKTVGASLAANIQLPLSFPVTLSLGYVGLGNVNVDSIALLAGSASGIALDAANDTKASASITVQDSTAIADKLRDVIAGYMQKGKFPSSVGLGGISLGASSSDVIGAFNKVAVSLPIDPVGQPIANYVNSTFNDILNGIPSGQLNGLVSGNASGPVTINLGKNTSITLNLLDASFGAKQTVNAKVQAGLVFPYSVDANIPFVTVDIGLDDVPGVSTQVTGFNVVGGGTSALSLGSSLQVKDSDSLADKIAAIADAFFASKPLPGSVNIYGATLGLSSSDSIQAFSEVAFPISLDRLVEPFISGVNRTIDVIGLINRFGFSFGGLTFDTPPGKAVSFGGKAGFKSQFPLAVNLPYLSLGAGLDTTNIVNLGVNNFALVPGTNNITLDGKAQFPSSPEIQTTVAKFIAEIIKGGWGSTTESVALSGIVLGASEADSIKALSKARILLPTNKLLTKTNANEILKLIGLSLDDLTFDGIKNRTVIKYCDLDSTQPGKIHFNCAVGLSGFNFTMNGGLGYLDTSLLLDDSTLAELELPAGLKIKTVDGVIIAYFEGDLYLKDSEPLEQSIATLVDQFFKTIPFTSKASVMSFIFGASKTDFIDTLIKAVITLDLDPILTPLRTEVNKLIDDLINGKSTKYKLDLNDLTVDWGTSTSLLTKFAAAIGGLPGQITANIPYFGASLLINGQEFILPVVNGLKLGATGNVSAVANLAFKQNDEVAQALWEIVGQVAFHRFPLSNLTVGVTGIVFGADANSAFRLASKASATITQINTIVDKIGKFFDTDRPLELKDIQAKIANAGIVNTITCTSLPAWLPASVNLGSVIGKVNYRMGGTGPPIYTVVEAIFTDIVVKPGQPISFKLLLAPDVSETGFNVPLQEAIPYLIEFEDYAQHAYLGSVTVWQGAPKVGDPFSVFSKSLFHAPPLYLWQPITLQPRVGNLFTKKGIEFELEFWWPNPGPLRLDVGVLDVRIQDKGTDLIHLATSESVVVQNVNEGGNLNDGKNTILGNVFTVTIPWSDFNPFTFFTHILDLLNPLKDYKIIIQTIRPGEGPVGWVDQGLEQLPGDLIANILPVIVALLSHVKIDLFGFSISASLIPGFDAFLKAAQAKLDQFPPKHWKFLDQLGTP